MLDDKLDGAATAVIVRSEAVGDAQPRRRRLFPPAAEVDRGERFAASVQAQGQLEVALADDAPVDDLEHAVEQGLREALPPGSAVAEGFGMGAVELGRRERAVAVDGGLQCGGIERGGGIRLEG